MSDTPRTDAECRHRGLGAPTLRVSADFARELEREVAALVAERDALRERDEATAWRPIESAPMDGTVVLLYGEGRVTCGSWIAEQDIMVGEHHHTTGEWLGAHPSGETTPAYWESHDGGFTEEHPPTHWMPLPQPPRGKEGGGMSETNDIDALLADLALAGTLECESGADCRRRHAALTALVAERDELKQLHAHLGQSYTMLAKECDALRKGATDGR